MDTFKPAPNLYFGLKRDSILTPETIEILTNKDSALVDKVYGLMQAHYLQDSVPFNIYAGQRLPQETNLSALPKNTMAAHDTLPAGSLILKKIFDRHTAQTIEDHKIYALSPDDERAINPIRIEATVSNRGVQGLRGESYKQVFGIASRHEYNFQKGAVKHGIYDPKQKEAHLKDIQDLKDLKLIRKENTIQRIFSF